MERYLYGDNDFLNVMTRNLIPVPVPILTTILARQIGKMFINYAYGQGMGRHSKEEVQEIGYGDLKAFSDFLGGLSLHFNERIIQIDK